MYCRTEACPQESTKRSRSNQPGSSGSKVRKRDHSTYAAGASAIAVPGCPSPAFWIASMARVRTVSMASRSCSVACAVVVTLTPWAVWDRSSSCGARASDDKATRWTPRDSAVVHTPPCPLRGLSDRPAGSLAGRAGLDPAPQRQLAQDAMGRDRPLALGQLAALPVAFRSELPGLHVVGEHD